MSNGGAPEMSLRDFFAATVLGHILEHGGSDISYTVETETLTDDSQTTIRMQVKTAYAYADMMFAEREK